MLSCLMVISVSSCESDDVNQPEGASCELSFKVDVQRAWTGATSSSGVVSRGIPVEDAAPLQANGFGLSAIFYTGEWPSDEQLSDLTTDFAHDRKITLQNGVWKASDMLNWTGAGKLRFYAYYPHSAMSEGCITHSAPGEKGAPTLTYTVPDDVKKQPDILYATNECNSDGSDGAVQLKFGHALTAVTVRTGNDMPAGTINSITLTGVYGKGTYKIGSSSWTPQGSPTNFKITDSDIRINTEPGSPITSGNLTLMMIPQTLPAEAKLTIVFTDDQTNTTRTVTADIGGKKWEFGKSVAFALSSTGIEIVPEAEGGEWNPTDSETGKASIHYKPEDLKMGDYYYADGSLSDGGLRSSYIKEDGTIGYTCEEPRPEPLNIDGNPCIGIVFRTGRHENDNSDYSLGRYEDDPWKLADNTVHGYVIALSDATVDASGKSFNCSWGATNILGCMPSDTDGYISYDYHNQSDIDWNGYEWTRKIIAAAGIDNLHPTNQSGYPATYYAVKHYEETVHAPANSSGWFLPSFSQQKQVFKHSYTGRYLTDTYTDTSGYYPAGLFGVIAGSRPETDWYWSSSENCRTSSEALSMSWNTRTAGENSRTKTSVYCCVRPILVF